MLGGGAGRASRSCLDGAQTGQATQVARVAASCTILMPCHDHTVVAQGSHLLLCSNHHSHHFPHWALTGWSSNTEKEVRQCSQEEILALKPKVSSPRKFIYLDCGQEVTFYNPFTGFSQSQLPIGCQCDCCLQSQWAHTSQWQAGMVNSHSAWGRCHECGPCTGRWCKEHLHETQSTLSCNMNNFAFTSMLKQCLTIVFTLSRMEKKKKKLLYSSSFNFYVLNHQFTLAFCLELGQEIFYNSNHGYSLLCLIINFVVVNKGCLWIPSISTNLLHVRHSKTFVMKKQLSLFPYLKEWNDKYSSMDALVQFLKLECLPAIMPDLLAAWL